MFYNGALFQTVEFSSLRKSKRARKEKEPVTNFGVYPGYGTEDMYHRKPDASLHDPSPAYLRGLLEAAGITQEAAATALGITDRVMRYYLSSQESATYRPAPYAIQYALEQLAAYAANKRRVKRT